MVCMREKKLLTGLFVGVCLLAMGAATAAQAQSRSARGVDMRGSGVQQQENPCESSAKIHLPVHPNADSDGCVSVVAKTPSGNFVVGVTSSFEEDTTFEGDTVFEGPIKIGNATGCTSSDAGTLRYNSGMLEYCDGSSFKDLEGDQGPQGSQGPRGPRGPRGASASCP